MSWSKYADEVRYTRWFTLYSQEHSKWYIPDAVDIVPGRQISLFFKSIFHGIPTSPLTLLRVNMSSGEESAIKVSDILMDGVWRVKTLLSVYDPHCSFSVCVSDSSKLVIEGKLSDAERLEYIPLNFLTTPHALFEHQKFLTEKGYEGRANICTHYRNRFYDVIFPIQLFLGIDEESTELWAQVNNHLPRYNMIKDSIVFQTTKQGDIIAF